MTRDDWFCRPDDDGVAAHQQELENWQWLLSHDAAYLEWLEHIEKERRNEIPTESIRRF